MGTEPEIEQLKVMILSIAIISKSQRGAHHGFNILDIITLSGPQSSHSVRE
jgi:hypothetical protein